MQTKWTLTPWMQRRIARHIQRGSSPRMVQCLLNGTGTQRVSEPNPDVQRAKLQLSAQTDNVVLFKKPRLVA